MANKTFFIDLANQAQAGKGADHNDVDDPKDHDIFFTPVY
jgi:hypothetical protein